MKKGTVKFFNSNKGFGFIKSVEEGTEIFVHNSGLKSPIKEGDEVTYEEKPGKNGLAAVNVEATHFHEAVSKQRRIHYLTPQSTIFS